ncbi:hypothetical protein CEXT_379151 [Caerostris extrusa]|uniref:Uncharacterized protein n=1 Tax=Caerostris extrusa TaxID=172846 RepID=A0AAV4QMF7_CAEEX|nr:hypothetical protein CEXT_379151 [Caerostris extrusa]
MLAGIKDPSADHLDRHTDLRCFSVKTERHWDTRNAVSRKKFLFCVMLIFIEQIEKIPFRGVKLNAFLSFFLPLFKRDCEERKVNSHMRL